MHSRRLPGSPRRSEQLSLPQLLFAMKKTNISTFVIWQKTYYRPVADCCSTKYASSELIRKVVGTPVAGTGVPVPRTLGGIPRVNFGSVLSDVFYVGTQFGSLGHINALRFIIYLQSMTVTLTTRGLFEFVPCLVFAINKYSGNF